MRLSRNNAPLPELHLANKQKRTKQRHTRLACFTVALFFTVGCTLTSDPVPEPIPTKNKAVVFDIDGTLTPTVSAIFSVRENAVESVQQFADNGYQIIYLSARVAAFQYQIPGWLKKNKFPAGRVHVTESKADRDDHAKFKFRILSNYVSGGWQLHAAYGDSSTDFDAYARAGIQNVYALKRVGAASCFQGIWLQCYDGWAEQRDSITTLINSN